ESDRITRYLEDIDLARERAVVLQEEIINQLAQEQNTRMYVLSVVAAIFLPLTFVTGLLGMNVGGLPGVENPQGFWFAAVIMTACSILMILYFRWRKWI
ncbi:MAG: zinc transporter ZntB, partial [Gammaproteobacteria bacterium]|nr:zinc transporter ZntB [Gammaproteobacteria bacterium]